MAELLRRLKRHAERYYNFAKSVIYKHLFEACPGVNCILFLLSHFQLAQQVNLRAFYTEAYYLEFFRAQLSIAFPMELAICT
ncbi:hypothetical protein CLHUN_35640 [Ruminiclostridium hungatei]|uniref:Uncharacterized protein n=1 Tax=Ruminiclostridium hungatei TaxID=48256 RepID=A0A1V4SH58_RUMHU|nr:hypothetical protein CLHUN_35640 [Ruminiclostridium hungatei]